MLDHMIGLNLIKKDDIDTVCIDIYKESARLKAIPILIRGMKLDKLYTLVLFKHKHIAPY